MFRLCETTNPSNYGSYYYSAGSVRFTFIGHACRLDNPLLEFGSVFIVNSVAAIKLLQQVSVTPPNDDDDDEGWWLVAGHPSWAQTRDPGPGNILTFLINSAATAQPRAEAVTRLAQSVTQCYKAALQSVTKCYTQYVSRPL